MCGMNYIDNISLQNNENTLVRLIMASYENNVVVWLAGANNIGVLCNADFPFVCY